MANDKAAMPWLSVFISGKPIPQGNLTGFVAGGKVVLRHSDNRLIAWRGYAAGILANAAPSMLTARPIAVQAVYYIARPKSHYKTDGSLRSTAPEHVTGRPDLDKYLRALLDAIQISGIIKDDSQVCAVAAIKVYSDDKEGVEVEIEPLDKAQ
jgi:Holliday junction resolvase RusA-like endonuclease